MLEPLQRMLRGNRAAVLCDCVNVAFGEYLSYGALFLLTIIISRAYGVLELGRFSLGVAIAGFLILATNSGISSILRRDIAANPAIGGRYAGTFMVIRATTLVAMGCVAGAVGWMRPGTDSTTISVISAIYIAKAFESLTELCYGLYQATNKMLLYSVTRAGQQAVLLGVGCAVALGGGGSMYVYTAYISIAIFGLIINVVIARKVAGIIFEVDLGLVGYAFRESWPILVNALVFSAYTRLGLLTLSFLRGVEAAGMYAAAMTVISGASMLASSIGIVLFPELCREFNRGVMYMRHCVNKWLVWLVLLGVGCAVVLSAVAPLVARVYGRLPIEAVTLLRVLAIGLVPLFGAVSVGYVLTVVRRQREGMYFAAVMLVLSAVLYYGLTRGYGTIGTGIAFVLSQVIWAVGAYSWAAYRLRAPVATRFSEEDATVGVG